MNSSNVMRTTAGWGFREQSQRAVKTERNFQKGTLKNKNQPPLVNSVPSKHGNNPFLGGPRRLQCGCLCPNRGESARPADGAAELIGLSASPPPSPPPAPPVGGVLRWGGVLSAARACPSHRQARLEKKADRRGGGEPAWTVRCRTFGRVVGAGIGHAKMDTSRQPCSGGQTQARGVGASWPEREPDLGITDL